MVSDGWNPCLSMVSTGSSILALSMNPQNLHTSSYILNLISLTFRDAHLADLARLKCWNPLMIL